MQKNDSKFFDIYKSAEKICRDICGEKGVTSYIEEMELKAPQGRLLVGGWDKYHKNLKHLRWLRNQIAHDTASYEVTGQDISDIERFHSDLLSQRDPLALLYKETRKKNKNNAQSNYRQPDYSRKANNKAVQKKTHPLLKLLLFAAAVFVITLICYFYFFNR